MDREQQDTSSSMPKSVLIGVACLLVHSMSCILDAVLYHKIETNPESVVSVLLLSSAVAGFCFALMLPLRNGFARWMTRSGPSLLAVIWFPIWAFGSVVGLVGASGGPNTGNFQGWQLYAILSLTFPFASALGAAVAYNLRDTQDWLHRRQAN